MTFELVVAADASNGIGRDGALPWHLPGDLAHFRALTGRAREAGRRNAVVMGRRTWASLPPRFRPLPGRLNVVVTRDASFVAEGARVVHGLDEALAETAAEPDVEGVFVIGGGELYRAALAHAACGDVHLTRVDGDHGCDVFFPGLEPTHTLVERSGPRRDGDGPSYELQRWARRSPSRG
ncbi:MAG: dihydrofolate reductase [Deltaproteobacteria bacterium]|nr:dihydrofolate reductase [Deltaproteobacteria bacterium]